MHRPLIVGLTGSIGMGKTAVAAMFRRLGIPVHDSDAAVHAALGKGGGAVDAVAAAFPGVVKAGAVDRGALGKVVFGEAAALKRLESILHPMVRASQARFLARARRRRAAMAVLDIPLLFETRGERRCDLVAVVSAPGFVQRRRVLARPGMTVERLAQIVAKQTPDSEKRRRADVVIPTGRGRAATLRAVKEIVTLAKQGKAGVRRRGRKGRI